MEALFFVGNQLIATSHTGRIGVWNAVTKHWQVRVLAGLAASFPGVQTIQTQGGMPFCSAPLERDREPVVGQILVGVLAGERPKGCQIRETFWKRGCQADRKDDGFAKEESGFSRH